MNCYEHTLLEKQDLQEKQASTLINKYQDIINKNSGNVLLIVSSGVNAFGTLILS